MNTALILPALLLALVATIPLSANEADPGGVPKGLNASDWSSIRAAYEAGRHQFYRQEDGNHVARNHGMGWQVTFDEKGFTATDGTWTWGLELCETVRQGEEETKRAPLVSGNRLSTQRSAALTEWFINDPRGLEQGWTLSAPAEIHLRVRGGLKPTVTAQSISFGGEITYSGLKAWDADGKTVPTHFEATAEGFAVRYDDADARYPVTIDPIAQQAYLKASNTGGNDQFGDSVAVSGDTVVVGAYGEKSNAKGVNGNQADNSANGAGAAYVFVRTGAAWTQQAYLKASNTGGNDFFGTSVAVSGNTVVVGAYGEASNATGVNAPLTGGSGTQADNSASGAGAAYVFVRTGTTWTQQAYLKASNTGADDFFGYSVTVSGHTVVVGAYLEDSDAIGVNAPLTGGSGYQDNDFEPGSGAAYVFVRTGTAWTQQAYLKANNTGGNDYFGVSVSVSGDTVLVGAYGEDSNATGVNAPLFGGSGTQSDNSAGDAGAAYVFVRTGTVWTPHAYLKASNTGGNDQFGYSVAVSGDTVVVGAYGEDSNATGVYGNEGDNSAGDAGAAYVFVRTGTAWTQHAYLKASNTGGSDFFGTSVAVSGDTVLVGASGEDSNATGVNAPLTGGSGTQADNSAISAGAAYVFVRTGTAWTQQAYLKASNAGGNDQFGYSVAVSGDTVVVGAYGEDSNATGVNAPLFGGSGAQNDNSAPVAGAAYLFRGLGPVLPSLARTNSPAPGETDTVFSAPGFAAVNYEGAVMFDQTLIGAGAAGGRNRGIFSTLAPARTVDLAFLNGTSLAGVGGYAQGSKVLAIAPPLCNGYDSSAAQFTPMGIFLVTATGTGVTTSNNKLLLTDDGRFVSFVRRTGQAVAELGDAKPNAFQDVLESGQLIAVCHRLTPSTTPLVAAANDSGLLLLNHIGELMNPTPPRENDVTNPKYGTEPGALGQFTGRAAASSGYYAIFAAAFKPTTGTAVPALFSTLADGNVTGRPAKVGENAPGTAGAKFATLPAFSMLEYQALFRATLTSGDTTVSNNEGLWRGATLLTRKNDLVDNIAFPGLRISAITRFWPVALGAFGTWGSPSHVLLQVTLSGGTPAATSANNKALLMRKADGTYLVLLRTGQRAPGAGPATLQAILAVDVDPDSGNYAVLGSLSGATSTNNQALWAGETIQFYNPFEERPLHLPTLRLRKGDLYMSTATPLGSIKGLTLKPAVDTTGAGGRGLAKAVSADRHAAVYILTDGGVTELVRLKL